MGTDEWPAITYQFTAFAQTGIEHLEVSDERTIVIYSRTIFDLEVDDGSLADAWLVTVEIFDAAPDRTTTDDLDPVALTKSLIDELAVTVGVDWERR